MNLPVESNPVPSETQPVFVKDIHPARAAIDVSAQIVGRVGNLLLGVIATAVLARGLGTYGFGEWSTILLLPGLLGYLNDLGFLQVAVRRATAEDDPRWLGALVTARAALSVPVTLLSIIVLVFVAHGYTMLLAGTIVASQLLLAAPSALSSIFQAQVRNDLAIIALTLNSVLWTTSVIIIANANGGLVLYAVAMTTAAVLSTGMQALVALRTVRIPIRDTHGLWRDLARTAVPLSIGGLLIVVYGQIDSLIVYTSAGTESAGLYNAAYRIVEQLGFVPLSLVVTLMPIVSRMVPARLDVARRVLQLALDLLAMFSLPALTFAIVASGPSIRLLYGSQFNTAAEALPILTGAFVFICCGYAFGVFTLVLDLNRQFAWFALIALVFNVVANLLFIPRYGFMAAAWTTLLTEMLVVGLIGFTIFRRLQMHPSLGRVARVAVAAMLSGASVLVARDAGAGVPVMMVVAVAAHTAGLFALRAIRLTEIKAILRRDPIGAL